MCENENNRSSWLKLWKTKILIWIKRIVGSGRKARHSVTRLNLLIVL